MKPFLVTLCILISNILYCQWLGTPDGKTIVANDKYENRFAMSVPSIDGGSIVVFAGFDDPFETDNLLPTLYIQKISKEGAIVWGSNHSAIILDEKVQSDWFYEPILSIKADGNGGAYVAWAETQNTSAVFLQHIDEKGQLLWGASGVLAGPQSNQQIEAGLSICVGNDKSVIVGWNALNNLGRKNLYAQCYNQEGIAQWPQGGKVVCTAEGSRVGELVTDGTNGAIAFFNDTRNNGIYAQRIDKNGNPVWDINGINICPMGGKRNIHPGTKYYGEASFAIPDGNGGAIVMFNDNRNSSIEIIYDQPTETNIDVYAQKLDANGNLLWGQAGKAIAIRKARINDVCEQVYPDGDGGAIVQSESPSNEEHGTCKLLQHLSASGERLWGDSGLVLTRGRIDEFYSNISTDKAGNTYAGFLYIPQPYHEQAIPLLSLRKINHNGEDLWGENGVLVRQNTPFRHPLFGPSIAPQSDGGAILVWSEADNYQLIVAAAKITAEGILAKTPITFTTIANGNWNDPTIWASGKVPDNNAVVVVEHDVTINVNISCYSLTVQKPNGKVIINPNIVVEITH
jgi:hypothetical protein